MTTSNLIVVLLITVACIHMTYGIRCYENFPHGGEATIVDCKECNFCEYSLYPSRSNPKTRAERWSHRPTTIVSALYREPDEADNELTKFIGVSSHGNSFFQVRVLSTCLFEETKTYEGGDEHGAATMLRCFCNTDLCNRAEKFSHYLGHLGKEEDSLRY